MKQKFTNQNKCGTSVTASLQATKTAKSFFITAFLLFNIMAVGSRSYGQGGTWTSLTNIAPDFNGGVMLLLTDGTVIAKTYTGSTYGTVWDKLTPDASGSYINGTWTEIAAMHNDRLYFSSQVLNNGQVYVAGGESGSGGAASEVYNPLTNTWTTPITIPGGAEIYDANSEILPNGQILQGIVSGGASGNYLYNPATNAYSAAPSSIGSHDESAWLKLPDGSILFVNIASTTSERYFPATNTWVADASLPVALYDTFDYESGAAFLLPNGKAFFIGSTSNTAIYTPSGNTGSGSWVAGPTIPAGMGAPDAAAAMMVNGKVLCAFSHTPTYSGDYADTTAFYEYDYTTNAFTLVSAPGGGSSIHDECYMTNMLDLPDGTVLFGLQGSKQYYEYTPSGTALTSGKPTVSSTSRINCDTFLVTGTLFTGISEGANFGDDWQMASNYPIVRLTSGSNVYYSRSFSWNRMGAVMTGSLADTAEFTLPAGLPAGTYSLAVVVNGNPSAPFSFNPGFAISPSTASVAAGGTTTLTDPMTGGAWSSSSTSIAAVGSGSGIVTGVSTGTATITYSAAGCITTSTVAVTGGTTALCIGATVVLTSGTTGGTWTSNNPGIATVTTAGTVTGVAAGTASVVYSVSGVASYTNAVVVNMAPSAVTGGSSVCQGSTVSLSDAITGGTWSSANTNITINSSTGSVNGISAGTAAVTYSVGTCTASEAITINPIAAITGGSGICLGSTLALSNAISGGTWSSGSTSIADISTAGIADGLALGTSVISYTLPTGCIATSLVIVNPGPAPIPTSTNICVGSAVTLTTSPSGGTWVSSSTSLATVNSSTGVVTGVASGTATITYSISSGCITTTSIAVNSVPAPISGPVSICVGSGATLIESGAGSWSSSNTSVAIVDYTGDITGLSPGTDTIYYILSSGCMASTIITVNAVPAAIGGTTVLCKASTATLSDGVSGGAWSSNNTGIANVDPGTGIVTGSSAGNATIYYSIGACGASVDVTINPSPATITGTTSACVGSTTALSDATTGGTWNSSNNAIASVDPAAGIVTGILSGTTSVFYTLPTGCMLAKTITINNQPAAISGTAAVCTGSTTTLSDGAAGGTWSSSNTAISTVVSGTGTVTGVSAGTATVSYSVGAGCAVSAIVTVNGAPAVIGGVAAVCVGSTATLTDGTASGTWSSGNTSIVGIVPASGVATGVASGTAAISYLLPTGCTTSIVVTVNAVPAAISGTATVCNGATTILTDGTTGGTWTVSNTTIANIANGVIAGVSSGTSTVSYTSGSGCIASKIVTVNAVPAAIGGTSSACVGATTTLSDGTASGTWTSSNTSVLSIVSASGIATGVASGSATISYSLSTGCRALTVVTVNVVPAAISGTATVCNGATTALTDGTSGGTWTISNTAIANIANGVVTGVSSGTSTVSYASGSGCLASKIVTVNPLPAAIGGTASACVGATTALTDGTASGTWSSSNTSIASVVSTTGVTRGVAGGTATISYKLSSGCGYSAIVTVNAVPAAISGTATVCAGSTTALSDGTTNGTWASSSAAIAAVASGTGVVSGVASGTATISYTSGFGCLVSKIVTVNAVPAAITGTGSVCVGSTTTLADATKSGTWASSSTAIAAIVSSTGVVTGASAGATTVSYSLSTGCRATAIVTVNPLPAAISGTATVCAGSTTVLADATSGGTWVSGTTAKATASGGTVSGVAAGSSTISYTLGTGCRVTKAVTVNALPSSISGSTTICIGSTATQTDAGGGAWTSSNTALATVGASTGVVKGVAAGTPIITYKLSTGCIATKTLTIHSCGRAMDNAVCIGATINLSEDASGGTWSSSNDMVAKVDEVTGTVTGISAGNVTMTYVAGSESITVPVSVYPVPSPVMLTAKPSSNIAEGQSVTLTAVQNGSIPQSSYQWLINGNPVAGANSATFTNSSFADNDLVACEVMGLCGQVPVNNTITIKVNQVTRQIIPTGTDVRILPNPNNGSFTIKGTLGFTDDEAVSVDVTDMVGRVVYTDQVIAHNGNLDEKIQLKNTLANGMYILNLRSAGANAILHIVVEQ